MSRNLKRDDSSCKWSSERTPKLSPPPLWWEHKNEKEKFTPWCTINRRQRRGKANKSGGKRDTKLQLNTGVNGWEFARPGVTSASPPLLPEWAGKGGWGREGGRDGRTEGERGDLLTLIGNEQIKGSARWQVINQASNQRWQLSIKALFQYTLPPWAVK